MIFFSKSPYFSIWQNLCASIARVLSALPLCCIVQSSVTSSTRATKVSKLTQFPFSQGPHIWLWWGREISSAPLPLPACRIWSLLSISNRGRPPQGTFAIQSSACCCFRQHQAVTNTPLNLQSRAQRGGKKMGNKCHFPPFVTATFASKSIWWKLLVFCSWGEVMHLVVKQRRSFDVCGAP